MGVVNASALTALQTRINAERSRRDLADVTFTGGVATGQPIQAVHFTELRNATEGLDTLGSQTFNWSGTIAPGASITDVLPQIDNFISTLESEVLADWKTISPYYTVTSTTYPGNRFTYYEIPATARSSNLVRWKVSNSQNYGTGEAYLVKTSYTNGQTPAGGYIGWPNLYQCAVTGSSSISYDNLNASTSPGHGFDAYLNLQFSDKNHGVPWNDDFPYTQTPYIVDTKPDGQGYGNWNDTHGSIWYGNGYACTQDHWYYLTTPCNSTFPNLMLAEGVTAAALPVNLTIEAYY